MDMVYGSSLTQEGDVMSDRAHENQSGRPASSRSPSSPEDNQTTDKPSPSDRSRRGLVAGAAIGVLGLVAAGAYAFGLSKGEAVDEASAPRTEEGVDDQVEENSIDLDSVGEDPASNQSMPEATATDYTPLLHSKDLKDGREVFSAFLMDVENYINHQSATDELIEPLYDISVLYADHAPERIFEEWEEDRRYLHGYIQEGISSRDTVRLAADIVDTNYDGQFLTVTIENFTIDTDSFYQALDGTDQGQAVFEFGKDEDGNTIITEMEKRY